MANNQLDSFRVLIVDDERMIQRLVNDVLLSLGFRNIAIASSGRQAIHMVSHQKFDFMITDWCMPDMDGIELVRFVRNAPESVHATMPIIMLTGNTEAKYVLTAMNAGINGYLIKPFSAAQLVNRIRTMIEHPRPFVMAPKYRGPDRRHADKGSPSGGDRRKKRKK